jgi:hypothetical protein
MDNIDTVFIVYEYRNENLPMPIGIGSNYIGAYGIIIELINKYKINATEIQPGRFKDNDRIFGHCHYWISEVQANKLFKDV